MPFLVLWHKNVKFVQLFLGTYPFLFEIWFIYVWLSIPLYKVSLMSLAYTAMPRFNSGPRIWGFALLVWIRGKLLCQYFHLFTETRLSHWLIVLSSSFFSLVCTQPFYLLFQTDLFLFLEAVSHIVVDRCLSQAAPLTFNTSEASFSPDSVWLPFMNLVLTWTL